MVWLQATYTPILDAAGMPVKVVKFANDVTEEVALAAEVRARLADSRKRQNSPTYRRLLI